ncbi:metallophosphoesterase family protein [Frankia sp. Cas3]|uniref:metallophosphoesterase family protein n=1 Tax=Frankia sp. Cas3 TaxID=3073926 RepID=UPI002AD39799|nr:metallophosphoesterase [Frankia sp. Cas3]
MVTIAAVGDLHIGAGAGPRLRTLFERAADEADMFLLAGDLTEGGELAQAAAVCEVFGGLDLPVIAVLGNHDHHDGRQATITEMLSRAGVTVLDGSTVTVPSDGTTVGIAGAKGFAGGFTSRSAESFGEDEMKSFARHGEQCAQTLRAALAELDTQWRIVLTHYAPVPDTLDGEPLELFPFLGSHHLGAAIDSSAVRVALAVHGHAHYGRERGFTPGGTPVRNVAAPVIAAPYAVYRLPADPAGDEIVRLR